MRRLFFAAASALVTAAVLVAQPPAAIDQVVAGLTFRTIAGTYQVSLSVAARTLTKPAVVRERIAAR